MSAREYFAYKKQLIPDIMKAFHKLEEENDIIVIEGAGSPAEINLKENDTVASVAKVRKASAEIDGEEVEISDEDESEKSEEGSVSETTEQETTEE